MKTGRLDSEKCTYRKTVKAISCQLVRSLIVLHMIFPENARKMVKMEIFRKSPILQMKTYLCRPAQISCGKNGKISC